MFGVTGATCAHGVCRVPICAGCTVGGDGPHECARTVIGVQAAPAPCACQVYERCASHRRLAVA